MIDDRTPDTAGSPAFLRKIGSWLLVIPSVAIGIILVELFGQLFPSLIYNDKLSMSQRINFLDGPATIYQNQDDIFTYVTNGDVRNFTVFFQKEKFDVEFDYHFRTNNFGLVEETDLVPDRDSLLVLGDSFTEGQGAEPWFVQVSPEIAKRGYQPVNGGLLGTGFTQWNKLQRYLTAKNVRIRKVVVVFISDDYRRLVWQPTPMTLQCLSTLTLCRVENSFFYRLPPPDELSSWVAKIRTARNGSPERTYGGAAQDVAPTAAPLQKRSWLGAHAEAWLPASAHVYAYLKEKYNDLRHPDLAKIARFDQAEQQSHAAIADLIHTYGRENVVFIHIPMKDEIGGSPIAPGLKARQSIAEAGGKLVDGFGLCGLTFVDYYRNDDHPNRAGYAKIAACVTKVINQM